MTTEMVTTPAARTDTPNLARVLPVLIPVKLTAAYSANGRLHWAAKAKLVRELREATTLALVAQWGPERRAAVATWGPLALDISYWRAKGQREQDSDNLVTSVKPGRDALAACLGIDDRIIAVGTVWQGKDPDGTGALMLRLRAVLAGEPDEVEA